MTARRARPRTEQAQRREMFSFAPEILTGEAELPRRSDGSAYRRPDGTPPEDELSEVAPSDSGQG
jgi:hypothetical protein